MKSIMRALQGKYKSRMVIPSVSSLIFGDHVEGYSIFSATWSSTWQPKTETLIKFAFANIFIFSLLLH